MGIKKIFRMTICYAVFLLFVSCAGRLHFKRGEEAFRTNKWDAAVEEYLKAVQSDPNNPRYRLSLTSALVEASRACLERGEKLIEENELKLSLIEFQRALDFYPENLRAKKRKLEVMKKIDQEQKSNIEKTAIEKIKEKAQKAPLNEPMLGSVSKTLLKLKFSNDTDLKQIFSTLQQISGVSILYDEEFKSKKLSIDLENVTFKDALDKLLLITGLFYKVIDEQSILIIPDTPAKRKEYEELVLRTFYISNGDVNQIQGLLRTLAEINTIAVNPVLNTIIIRESPKKIGIAEKIISSQDKSNAELIIDVEILEVNKTRMKEYGIELSNYFVTQYLAPGSNSLDKGSSLVRGHMFYNIDSSDFLFSIPSVSYKLMESDATSKVIAKPQLRVIDGETVTIKLGDKVPVPMTSFVPIAAGGPNQQAITSYQLYDVGINMEMTPRVHHNGDITLKMKFELTFITSQGTATLPPTIGNRSVSTIIRMRDNETGLLAGLLRDSERKAWDGFPGLRNIPIINWLFGKTKKEIIQTDIILTLTPRIIRMPDISEEDLASIWVGTGMNIGLKNPPSPSIFEEKEGSTNEVKEREDQSEGSNLTEVNKKEEEIQKPKYQNVVLSILPSATEVPPKTEFSAQIKASNAENIASMILLLNYNPDLILIKEIKEGTLMRKDGARTSFMKNINSASGTIQIGITREEGKKGISGEGEIFTILCESKKEGESLLEITSSTLWDSAMYQIPVEYEKGKIIIK